MSVVKMKAPPDVVAIKYGKIQYNIAHDGVFSFPSFVARHLLTHGFTPADPKELVTLNSLDPDKHLTPWQADLLIHAYGAGDPEQIKNQALVRVAAGLLNQKRPEIVIGRNTAAT
jgi:hypothetical protein